MADLLSLLSLGSAAIAAQNTGVAVASNNVANANTDGFSRQRVDLESLPAAPLVGGVIANSPTRIASSLLSAQIQSATGSLAMSQAFSAALTQLQSVVAGGGTTIDESLGDLFLKVGQAAALPTDPGQRQAVIDSARALAQNIQERAAATAAARQQADQRIQDNAKQATALAAQLAQANKSVATSNDPQQLDNRDKLAKQLSELVGGQARVDTDGQMRFVLDGGAVLVDGSHAAQLITSPDKTTGFSKVEVVNGAAQRDVTSQIGGGSIGADLKFRDQTAAGTANQLDQLAFDVTTSMNAVHTANAGLDGVTGRVMFTPVAQVAGAASQIAVDPGLIANPSQLALAAPGAGPGDNQGGLALFGVASQSVASGGTSTLGDAALSVVGNVASASSDAQNDVTRETLVANNLAGLRDSLSGVDTNEELTNLARFENASTAMGKVVSTVNDMLSTLITSL